MSFILQIETATTVCSVALAQDGNVIAVKQLDERNIHAEVITLYIDELLTTAGLQYSELAAVAVSSGPGSYTGLRIGVSTAKGLCFALDKPLIAIETLDAMAEGIIALEDIEPKTLLCPMIDARRMEVYTALFDAAGNVVKPTSAEIIDEYSFAEELKDNQILFFGDGAKKCQEVLEKNTNAKFIPDFTNSAAHLTKKAAQKFLNGEFEDVAYFEPFYLKDFLVTTPKKA
ncbi:tRNA (adenosine(37)-N6)-threonylcarbamoyltransferase complex dimerization subunit type 1 TsaB [Mucilaginibacter sp. UR6-11]|uniref:tRNA (adenosine(37)-N6)-threonylcarbamoyltransferase complex dimerization subunit type 1 TsaB n=1 Tax=Mucilaginibacter sp. UR6-11 TaxID=1435644 RepID=UPI001E3F1793|nr:tRNA (adenosine(37)-N6)-threonylcarbamoyltransferase complex dimerization subunit type 1 TsaB [Mucilaginibacter sp. UR6-11]MCC8423432.1 tRNA (adenosine(37)-N6)-threonylcarbamoyltransferase complex dimerization subunit type 1 TsaB [Mucilaginibacter sp. UR6-11]